ncbi:MAG: hypothetical protein J3R72DRAFT_494165 [Linnemannia gamsii]|nr:MAG: hypothetical protein J3R72DRAFT_494165 [Linnemannia gamsii]
MAERAAIGKLTSFVDSRAKRHGKTRGTTAQIHNKNTTYFTINYDPSAALLNTSSPIACPQGGCSILSPRYNVDCAISTAGITNATLRVDTQLCPATIVKPTPPSMAFYMSVAEPDVFIMDMSADRWYNWRTTSTLGPNTRFKFCQPSVTYSKGRGLLMQVEILDFRMLEKGEVDDFGYTWPPVECNRILTQTTSQCLSFAVRTAVFDNQIPRKNTTEYSERGVDGTYYLQTQGSHGDIAYVTKNSVKIGPQHSEERSCCYPDKEALLQE